MDINKIVDFIASTYGIQFFMQYGAGKLLDKIQLGNKKERYEENWLEFYTKALELLCEKMKWEFDAEAVYREFREDEFILDDIQNEISIDRVLCKLLGKNYEKCYGTDLRIKWVECIKQCIVMPEFDKICKDSIIEMISKLQNGQEQILDEVKKIKICQKDIETELKKKEAELINKENIDQFKCALEDIENGDYASAIDKLKYVNVWAKDNHIKFISYFKIGFCYTKLNIGDRYSKALNWFRKAEKICDYESDDVVLLFRNMALTYIHIGQIENKISNYTESNKYLKKIIRSAKEEDILYCSEALIHLARNYMDMCDEIPMKDVRKYLEISEMIMIFICCCECKLTADMMYVLVHNMARVFYHKAEKVDSKYMKIAQELYEYVITMDYVRSNKELLAMSNINAGLSYQFASDNKLENAKKAIAFYEMGISLYEAKNEETYKYQIANAKLNIASAYKTIYYYSKNMEDFKKAIDKTKEIISQEKYNQGNSLLYRTYMLQLYLYVEVLKDKKNTNGYIDLDDVCNKLCIMSKQVNYEKYTYSYQLLMCELDLLLMDENNYDKIASIKQRILDVQKATHEGNKNISLMAEKLLEEYVDVFDRYD